MKHKHTCLNCFSNGRLTKKEEGPCHICGSSQGMMIVNREITIWPQSSPHPINVPIDIKEDEWTSVK